MGNGVSRVESRRRSGTCTYRPAAVAGIHRFYAIIDDFQIPFMIGSLVGQLDDVVHKRLWGAKVDTFVRELLRNRYEVGGEAGNTGGRYRLVLAALVARRSL